MVALAGAIGLFYMVLYIFFHLQIFENKIILLNLHSINLQEKYKNTKTNQKLSKNPTKEPNNLCNIITKLFLR